MSCWLAGAATWLAVAGAGPERVSFHEAVARALHHQLDVQVAEAEVQHSSGAAREVWGTALPALNGNVVYTELDHARTLGGRTTTPGRQANAMVSLLVPAVAPRAWAAVRHAHLAVGVAAADRQAVRRRVAVGVAHAYLAVVTQGRLLTASRQAVATARAHLDFVQARADAGVGTQLDALRADQELAAGEAQLEATLAALRRLQEALGIWIGGDRPVDAESTGLQLSSEDLAAAADTPAEADRLGARADVRALRLRLAAAQQQAADDWLSFVPNLNLMVQAYHQRPPTPTYPRLGWQLTAILQVPFYDGGQRYGQRQQHRAAVAQASHAADHAARLARSEARAARDGLTHAAAAREAAQRAAARAEGARRLAAEAYAAGTTNNLEVIDAERRARDAAIAAVMAEDGVQRAHLDLAAACGQFPDH